MIVDPATDPIRNMLSSQNNSSPFIDLANSHTSFAKDIRNKIALAVLPVTVSVPVQFQVLYNCTAFTI